MFEAQDENHDYEAIPLKNVPPLPPARASSPTSPVQKSGQYENLPASSAQEDHDTAATTTLLSPEALSDNDEHDYEPTCAASSIDTPTEATATPTSAVPTISSPTSTSPEQTEYEQVEYIM